MVGGSDGSGAKSTFAAPPKPGAAYAGTLTAVMGMTMSTPATAIFATPVDLARVIDHSLHRVPNIT
jgi:hypothetical protein